jgi:site-specific DNA recombinase
VKRAATYLRSSKDRSDVSIDAQRRELAALADARGFVLVEEFVDVVVSGKDENRAGFQSMLRSLKGSSRAWSAILMLDTSRLARSQYVAHVFRHECRKRGIEVVFAKTPEVDGVAGIILPAVLHAMDEVHSFMSREKGLAGMAENVRRGWRAGGRAPFGYLLERVETGAIREGEPVAKSRLMPGPDFDRIAAYLKGRVAGQSQRVLMRDLGLELSAGSLVGIERNALTYAGHTAWNTMRGTRPREEWVIQRDTHAAAISEADADALLARLGAPRRARDRGEAYLLAGLLRSPSGAAWQGNAGYYRLARKNVSAPRLEEEVLAAVVADLRDPAFAAALVKAAKAAMPRTEEAEQLSALEGEVKRLEARARAFAECLPQTTAKATIFGQIEETEAKIREARGRAERLKAGAVAAQRLREIGPADVRVLLNALVEDLPALDRAHLKDFLRQVLERVELDAAAATCTIHYRIAAGGVKLASPRRAADNPTLTASRVVQLPFRRLRAA